MPLMLSRWTKSGLCKTRVCEYMMCYFINAYVGVNKYSIVENSAACVYVICVYSSSKNEIKH